MIAAIMSLNYCNSSSCSVMRFTSFIVVYISESSRDKPSVSSVSSKPRDQVILERTSVLPVVRGLLALLLQANYSCHTDMFMIAAKVRLCYFSAQPGGVSELLLLENHVIYPGAMMTFPSFTATLNYVFVAGAWQVGREYETGHTAGRIGHQRPAEKARV